METEIKYHALSTSILIIRGYNSILLPDIYHTLNAHAPCHLIQVSKNRLSLDEMRPKTHKDDMMVNAST